MDTADSQHLSRISKMLLAGAGVAFAWMILSLSLGLSGSSASAADGNGLLDTVGSTVEGTASAATGVVADTAAAVGETAAPVVESVAPAIAPATDSQPVAPVVDVVQSTVASVTELPADGVVAPIADVALGVVAEVPVVGDAVSALGGDTAVSAVGTSVDGLLTGTATAVGGTVSDVIGAAEGIVSDPAVPPLPGLDGVAGVPAAIPGSGAAADALGVLVRAAYLSGVVAWEAFSSESSTLLSFSDGSFVSGSAVGGILALLRSVMQADSVLMGPGGAGPGAWVLVALGFVVAYRAWMRRSGLENDVAPPAPVLATDVSPD
ncbi:hypothetical protein SAMN04487846_0180 [Microbacterium sp. cf046]|uniref:hypothetical protein n=1 Tax=Microbacterium sp. cf046 TaxID=1761803 RepID=UPI0008F2DF83|nr:hypothetical protein [Microbacterium sp. cf046]SFR87651.1 hypothetical protein SAMN04487846_0180 [Microbacterium sp. cf046]